MRGYKILGFYDVAALNTEIADLIKQGWVPSGDLRCATGVSGVRVFQAMKLEDTTAE